MRRAALIATLAFATAGCAAVVGPPRAPEKHDHAATWQKSLARPPLAVSAAFDARSRLWLARVEGGHVLLSISENRGASFSTPVRVNPDPERVAAEGENRPKIAFGAGGEIYVSWTQSLEQPFSGHVRFSRSLDGGRTFSLPVTVNDNRELISHRFESMIVDRRGAIHLAWLDRRDAARARQRGEAYTGISVYHAVSRDGGKSFDANHQIAEHSCECCRIAIALDTDDVPVIFWRHVFGRNTRDHALVRLDGKSKPARVSHDDWGVDACPHHGPSLSIGTDGIYHLAWFNGATGRVGLNYSRTTDRGGRFSSPLGFGNSEAQAAHPQVLALGNRVWLAWKEFDGRESTVQIMHSTDSGLSWSTPAVLASTDGASDHPLLFSDGVKAYLSWNTVKQGYRLITLQGEKS
ncbi:MAG: hypothetical protein NUV55_13135 [Sulfuricaulis sp.]|uniref:hypothetical protein n=1 Tax=Sulfuricaulis sp. TaxID=2003553 RepID=UPI0025E7F44A|nr:hypothetical protein [Sulfuricaulis sp.]MCR4348125.1 hypothetical protein [Sulfuricaulis sp.]